MNHEILIAVSVDFIIEVTMKNQEMIEIKTKFYEILGILSIEEIMSNHELVVRINVLTQLLIGLSNS
jgi:hypothetical protein